MICFISLCFLLFFPLVIDDDFAALYTVYGDMLFNALEIIDNELIEKVTIRNTPRCYFLVGIFYFLFSFFTLTIHFFINFIRYPLFL